MVVVMVWMVEEMVMLAMQLEDGCKCAVVQGGRAGEKRLEKLVRRSGRFTSAVLPSPRETGHEQGRCDGHG